VSDSTRANWLISALRLLPRNTLSRMAGRLVSLRLPRLLQRWQILMAVRIFRINLVETRDPVDSFACFQDFFTRALVPGARPIDPTPDAIVSPCDGAWGESGVVENGQVLQVKQQQYPLAALLGSEVDARAFEGGHFATFYLSPADYHRFHSPCDVEVSRLRYLPGSLWPVNRSGIQGIEGLFAQNERICAFMDVLAGERTEGLCVVAVGATMVGKVRLVFDSIQTNRRGARTAERHYGDGLGVPRPRLATGAEWGRFEFGSTLVVLVAPDVGQLDFEPAGTKLRMGSRIGRLRRLAA